MQILYGIGKAVLRDYSDATNILALSKLKDLGIDFSGSEEEIKGGDSPFAFATFPKDKAVKISAENAVFDLKGVQLAQGGAITSGSVTFTEIEDYEIPVGATAFATKITLSKIPTSGSVVLTGITGLTLATVATWDATTVNSAVTAGKYAVNYTTGDIYFNPAQKLQDFTAIYKRASAVATDTLSVLNDSMSKPFEFIHRVPIYDDENKLVAQGQLTIYKCRATTSFQLGLKPQTAFAPKFELQSMESGRSDKKIWDFSIETV